MYWERRASTIGVVQVEQLTENGRDVTYLIGGEKWFQDDENRVEALRAHLAGVLSCSIDEIEIEEPDENDMNALDPRELK